MGDFYAESNNNTGGGFQGSQGTPGGSQGSQRSKSKQNQSLIPVTCKQVLDAEQPGGPDDNHQIDGRDAHVVSLVGCTVEIEETSTCINLQLEDGSGRLEVKKWVDDGEEADVNASKMRATWTEGTYVHVVGNIRVHNNKKGVVAFNIKKVEDMNKLTHHMLEACFCHLKSQQPEMTATSAFNAAASGQAGQFESGTGNFNGEAQQDFGQQNGESILQNMVIECVKQLQNTFPDGVDIKKITEDLVSKGQNTAHISKAIAFLQDEGQLYSTTDDDHVKTTEW